jgi:hypothetical protein
MPKKVRSPASVSPLIRLKAALRWLISGMPMSSASRRSFFVFSESLLGPGLKVREGRKGRKVRKVGKSRKVLNPAAGTPRPGERSVQDAGADGSGNGFQKRSKLDTPMLVDIGYDVADVRVGL